MHFKKQIPILALAALLALPVAKANATSEDTMNFRFSPVILIVGAMNVNLDVSISEKWTLGPDVGYWRLAVSNTDNTVFNKDFELTAWAAGARANWFSNGVFK